MNKESYWERRQAQNMYEYMEDADKTADQIAVLYLKSSQYLNKSLDKIFERYRKKHHLSRTEALLLLNTMQDKTSLAELRRKLKEGDGNKKELVALLEAPAYAARLERLEHLMGQIDQMMTEIYQQEKQISTAHYIKLCQKSYYHTIYDVQQRVNAAFSFSAADTKTIDQALHSKWSGKNYSERIWGNTQVLADRVKEELMVNLLAGRTNREAAEIIEKEFAKGAANARRLVWTESAQMGKELNFKAYEEMKVEKYRYLATLDLKTCEKCCRPLDRKVFPVKDRQDGVNCPPMHPWCRCTTVGVISDELEAKLKRWARDPVTGKGMLVPKTMAYQEWYGKYVKGNPDAEFKEEKVKAFSADKAQYERYKKVLGRENVPKTLDAFQNVKYTEPEKWRFVKLDYKRRSELLKNPGLKLPDAENAVLPEGKFTKYLMGGENEKGLAKGRAFTSRLGYDINNWKELQKELELGASKYPVLAKNRDEFGTRYEQKMVLYGKKGTPANVVAGWLQKPDGTVSLTSAYIKEVE